MLHLCRRSRSSCLDLVEEEQAHEPIRSRCRGRGCAETGGGWSGGVDNVRQARGGEIGGTEADSVGLQSPVGSESFFLVFRETAASTCVTALGRLDMWSNE
jgi:hypothetical protein